VANEVVHDLGNSTKAYLDVRRFIDKTDVKIINATRTTKLNVFDKMTFEEAIEDIEKRQHKAN
jgi:hypothetical protein